MIARRILRSEPFFRFLNWIPARLLYAFWQYWHCGYWIFTEVQIKKNREIDEPHSQCARGGWRRSLCSAIEDNGRSRLDTW